MGLLSLKAVMDKLSLVACVALMVRMYVLGALTEFPEILEKFLFRKNEYQW